MVKKKKKDKVNTYTVVWEIEVDAKNEIEAAQMALKIQKDPDSAALVFDVVKHNAKYFNCNGIIYSCNRKRVDLLKENKLND